MNGGHLYVSATMATSTAGMTTTAMASRSQQLTGLTWLTRAAGGLPSVPAARALSPRDRSDSTMNSAPVLVMAAARASDGSLAKPGAGDCAVLTLRLARISA